MRYLPLLCLASVAVLVGCGSSAGSSAEPGAAPPTCDVAAPYAKAGTYAAGVTTLDVGGVKTEVWYPADRASAAGKARDVYDMREWLPDSERGKVPDAAAPLHTTNAYRDLPVKPGKYPVVLFSHGLGGYRSQSSFLMTHLASWGFVVVAPDHVERGLALVLGGDTSKLSDKAPEQLRAALAYLKEENARGASRFMGVLDLAHVAVAGHSMGGAAVSQVIDDADVTASVFLASPGFGESPTGKSVMFVWGSNDLVAKETNVLQNFQKQPAGARGVSVRGAGHMAFTDLCVIGKERGGVLQIALDHGIAVDDLVKQLASDGCGEQPDGSAYLPIEQGWEVIDHYVTAQLRLAFGIDEQGVGLDDAARKCFGDKVAALETK